MENFDLGIRLFRPWGTCIWEIELRGRRELMTAELQARFRELLNQQCELTGVEQGKRYNPSAISQVGATYTLRDASPVHVIGVNFRIDESNRRHRNTIRLMALNIATQMNLEFYDDVGEHNREHRIEGVQPAGESMPVGAENSPAVRQAHEADAAFSLSQQDGRCPVCSVSKGDITFPCPTCQSLYHAECWEYAGGCSIYGCRSAVTKAVVPAGVTALSNRDAQWANRRLIQSGFFRELHGPVTGEPIQVSGQLRNGHKFEFTLQGRQATMNITRREVPWWWILLVLPLLLLGFVSIAFPVLGIISLPSMLWLMCMTPRWEIEVPVKSYTQEIAGPEVVPAEECVDIIKTWVGAYQGGLPID